MTTATSDSANPSMEQLLERIQKEAAEDQAKLAADNSDGGNKVAVTGGASNPPTSGPGDGTSPTEEPVKEGERAREYSQDEKARGAGAAENANSSVSGHKIEREGELAGEVTTALDNPESVDTGPATGADPGSASGVTLENAEKASADQKTSSFEDLAGDLMIEFAVQHKVAMKGEMPDFIKDKMKSDDEGDDGKKKELDKESANESKECADDTVPEGISKEAWDFYKDAADGDVQHALQLHDLVHSQMADAAASGTKIAYDLLAHLQTAQSQGGTEEGADKAAAEGKPKQTPSRNGKATTKSAAALLRGRMHRAKKAMMDGGVDPAMDPAMAMQGGMPADESTAEGGDDYDMENVAGEDADAALDALAAQLGVDRPTLDAILENEMAGGGGEMGAEGGMPPEAAGGGEMPPEAAGAGGGEMPPEMKAAMEKITPDALVKAMDRYKVGQAAVLELADRFAPSGK